MPPRGRRPAAKVDAATTVEVRADASLWTDLAAIAARVDGALAIETDYNRRVALTKIAGTLSYGLKLAGR